MNVGASACSQNRWTLVYNHRRPHRFTINPPVSATFFGGLRFWNRAAHSAVSYDGPASDSASAIRTVLCSPKRYDEQTNERTHATHTIALSLLRCAIACMNRSPSSRRHTSWLLNVQYDSVACDNITRRPTTGTNYVSNAFRFFLFTHSLCYELRFLCVSSVQLVYALCCRYESAIECIKFV